MIKKKIIVIGLTVVLLCGCSSKGNENNSSKNESIDSTTKTSADLSSSSSSTKKNDDSSSRDNLQNEETKTSQDASNPWKTVTKDEFAKEMESDFDIPDGALNVTYKICEDDALLGNINHDSKLNEYTEVVPLGEVTFTMSDEYTSVDYVARMQKAKRPSDCISGYNYDEWDSDSKEMHDGQPVYFKRKIDTDKTVDVAYWYFSDTSLTYTLTVTGTDLDGFDISAVAYTICDMHKAKKDAEKANAPEVTANQLPDGNYTSYCDMVTAFEEKDGVFSLSVEKLYCNDNKVEGAVHDDWGMEYVQNITLTGDSKSIEYGDIDAGNEFEANSNLKKVKEVLQYYLSIRGQEVESATGLHLDIKDGKIVRLGLVTS